MRQLVVLKLGQGDWSRGFPTVTVQQTSLALTLTQPAIPIQLMGSLPAAPELATLYQQWRSLYTALNQRLTLRQSCSIEIEEDGITNVSQAALEELGQRLKHALDRWLESADFRKVERRLRTYLAPTDEIRLIVETENLELRRFPWHLWSFFEDYPLAEVALSAPEYGRVHRARARTGQVRILAVLGNSKGIDVQHDRRLLEQLPSADPVFLVEPDRIELTQQLWDQQGWDILFFAGHSSSQADGTRGEIAINPTDSLTIAQLKHALNAAISRGLQFALFNSCDGLGLAYAMADLNIPQLIVMREPVPDQVAQTFLKHLLSAFASGSSFYCSVREAREKLQGLESQFPCASWLPIICQNPTEIPPDWQTLVGDPEVTQSADPFQRAQSQTSSLPTDQTPNPLSMIPLADAPSQPAPGAPKTAIVPAARQPFRAAALTSLAVTGLVMGMRWLGGLQALELGLFDQLLRLRPAEVADPRLLVVEVTQDDTNQYGYPLQDQTLATLLEKLAQMQPRAIGVDMHRYQPRGTGRKQLLQQFQTHTNLFTVCWFGSTDKNFAPPPEFSETQRINQVGFSDLLLDGTTQPNPSGNLASGSTDASGGQVRRQILSYDPKVATSPPDCATPYSFSFQLAFRFLYDAGIQPLQVNPSGDWQLGKATFTKLPARFGGYQNLDGLSSQVMLNYRSALPGQRVTLQQVLQGQVSRSFVQDRVVLVGTTAAIARDTFATPYGEMPGIWIHAHQVSQMLSAVLDQRSLIWALPQWGSLQWGDLLWVWGWASIGAGCAWWFRSWPWLLLMNGIAVLGLYQLCWVALIMAGWLPLLPSLLALLLSSGTVYGLGRLQSGVKTSS